MSSEPYSQGSRALRLWPVGLALLLLLPLFIVQPWQDSLFGRELTNLGHVPLFAMIALLLRAAALRAGRTIPAADRIGLVGAVLLGIVAEGLQALGPREASLADVLRNAVGAAAALALLRPTRPASDPRRRRTVHLIAIAALLLTTLPMALTLEAYRRRAARWPDLVRFESTWEGYFLRPVEATLERVSAPAAWAGGPPSGRVGLLTLLPAHYPRLALVEPPPDWRGYDVLEISFFSELERPRTLWLRIHDGAHDGSFGDRFNLEFRLEPGETRLEVPLREIAQGPEARRLDLRDMRGMALFAVHPAGPVPLYVGPWVLRKYTNER
ncbi:MAG: hypothetical protein GY716_09515 [bacterium]|nr:hypothetical protein [bacterium]